MTPFSPELMQTLEDLIPAVCVSVAMAVIVYIAFLHNALINARQTCKDQGNMLAEYVHLQADDLIKVQNAYKNESAAMIKYNALIRDHHKLEEDADKLSKTVGNLVRTNERYQSEIKALKDKISRKNEPRDAKGHFVKVTEVKKNPNIGKYLCVDLVIHFKFGHYYERYESDTVDPNSLILIGDDRQRHSVLHTDFQLITE